MGVNALSGLISFLLPQKMAISFQKTGCVNALSGLISFLLVFA